MKTQALKIPSPIGVIECDIDWPSDEGQTNITGWALCLHPHPLFDGTKNNKVITTFSRACVSMGYVCFRPNFRGVGGSEGKFDDSVGETQDMRFLIDYIKQNFPQFQNKPWVLGGFSFGSAVAAQLHQTLKDESLELPSALILLGVAVWKYAKKEVELPSKTLLIHGSDDEIIPLKDVLEWLKNYELPLVTIPNSGHFFHGKLIIIKKLIEEFLR
ncbi:alpha/beta hydrolase [Taylorella equigenitalis]|uniref:Alpha/beta hydrolase n=1 Tax=Taylorella equigenitalis (strain MCE9) TaxID=937774 RepID=A0A654KGR7_TAYEM|nr:CocE/NonD family hydrolase [Taylorella equigenitalis]ADU91621.1 Alpha/beta hydrolase [Taylorella equigenitalis MCE9]WDU56413.1 alpha/beta hydrolase [Taylorella equigenitalis]